MACEGRGRTYPGFEREDGAFRVIGGRRACPNCDSSSFVPVAFDPSVTLAFPECGTTFDAGDEAAE